MKSKIPFLDLTVPHLQIEEEILEVVRSALRSSRFVGGVELDEFEKEWAAFCDVRYAVGVGSGTDALRFALSAAGVGKGDLVLTVPNTFIATTEAISQTGATFDFVDVDEHTYNIDVTKLHEYLEGPAGERVRAIVPVHLYGQPADMDPIIELAEKRGLVIVEDACQAHGAQYFSCRENRWRKSGSMGHAAAFSFYPGKNLGACGEGGAVTTDDPEIARRVRMLRDHGQAEKYRHEMEGYNGRLDAIQCGILRLKLRHLSGWNESRRQAAARYAELLSGLDGIVLPCEPQWSRSVYHLYVIRSAHRNELLSRLRDEGIGTGLHYPIPLHQQRAYAARGYKRGDYPIAETLSSKVLSLPMFPHLGIDQQRQIAAALRH